jgi:hypothetical protein
MNEEVPLNIGGRFRMGVRLPFYRLPDVPEKAQVIARVLSAADYFSVPSSTVWATILRLDRPDPRHPGIVYPYGSAVYRLLFSEKIGYTVDATFTRYPGIFGIEVNDDAVDLADPALSYRCDQSFSFYDHPKVFLFRNTGRLSEAEIYRRILEEARE